MDPQAQLAALAAGLPEDIYHALEAILRDLDHRVTHAQAPALSADDIRIALEHGFANTQFNLPPAHFTLPPAPPPPPVSVRPGQFKVDLAHFHGKDSDDLGAWLTLIEDYLRGQHIPEVDWPLQVPMLFRGEAQHWYVAQKKKIGRGFTWAELRKALTDKFDTPLRVETLRNELRSVPWKGNLTRYAAAFRDLETQIPEVDMTFGDRLSNFLSRLPVEFAKDIRRDKPKNVEEMYFLAREIERLSNLHHVPAQHQNNTNGFRKKTKGFTHRLFSSSSSSPSAASSSPSAPPTSSSPSTGPVPMDLDAMEQPPPLKTKDRVSRELNLFEGSEPPLFTDCCEEPLELSVLDLSDDAPEPHLLPTYAVQLAPSVNAKPLQLASAIIDTGAAYCYIKPSVVRRANLTTYPMTAHSVRGAGATTTSAWAHFAIKIGGWQKPICAFILDTDTLRFDMVIGQEWLQKYNAQPDWATRSWFLTDPRTCQVVRLHAMTVQQPLPLPRVAGAAASNRWASLVAAPLELYLLAEEPVTESPQETSGHKSPLAKIKSFGARLHARMKAKFPRLFRTKLGAPPAGRCEHVIDVTGTRPIRAHGRPLSPPEHEEVQKFVDEGLRDGIIEPSKSPWSAPLILIRKKDGKMRVCVDFRQLNNFTVRNAYPLPRIDDSYQNLRGARFFTTLDLRSGYWQIPLSAASRPLTAFATRFGHYQFRVMPLGLCNAPATFQNFMNDLLRSRLDRCVMVYLDDIIIYSPNLPQHLADVDWVLTRLDHQGLILHEDKCQWVQTELTYLGHIVSIAGVRPNPEKVQAITEWPRPDNVTRLRGFLNLTGYYRRFMKGFAKIAGPMYDLLKGNPRKRAEIKCYPSPWRLFVLDVDASGHAIGGILHQSQNDFPKGEGDCSRFAFKESDLRPIAFESRRMTPTEQRYVEGSPVVVRSDHESLKYFLSQKHLGRRLARFADNIAHFDVLIRYRPGRNQLAADALSRHDGQADVPDYEASGPLFANPMEPAVDHDRSALFETLKKWREDLLRDTSAEPSRRGFLVRDGALFHSVDLGQGEVFLPVPVNLDEALRVIREVHTDLGHLGVRAVAEALKSRVWLPIVTELVEFVIRRCDACQFTQREAPPAQPLHPLPRTDAFDHWAFDFIGPLVKSKEGNEYILTAMDHGTDFAYATAIPRRSHIAVIALLRRLITTHGKPSTVLTDNGEEFLSYPFQNYLQRLGIQHLHTSPYHPQMNGRLEKFNDMLVQTLARYTAPNRQDEWDQYLPDALLAQRAHVSRSHGASPFFLAFGRQPRLPHETTYDLLRAPPTDAEIATLQNCRLEHVQNLERFRTEANTRALRRLQDEARRREGTYHERALGIGDYVLRRSENPTKLHPRWDGPFIVHDVTDRNVYQLRTRNGYILRTLYNAARLKRYHPSNMDPELWYSSADLQRRDARARMQRRLDTSLGRAGTSRDA
ncbi:predicted protein [Sparassis crispa]|uniref:RNA-directed DNA polymerase n=1 Tax=Sparassis crispa TaxID=139825 RepID=A0A401G9C7_9APHY|nr:predicted protein [Sparassis crispa]GBE78770.1 predicted protein [Sparassis crispa]